LQLVPGQPTRYVLDGRQVPMRAQRVTVEVLGAGGRTEHRSHTLYRSRFGPVLVIPDLFESRAETAYALRDADADNLRLIDCGIKTQPSEAHTEPGTTTAPTARRYEGNEARSFN
jgi:hypothetical protein